MIYGWFMEFIGPCIYSSGSFGEVLTLEFKIDQRLYWIWYIYAKMYTQRVHYDPGKEMVVWPRSGSRILDTY